MSPDHLAMTRDSSVNQKHVAVLASYITRAGQSSSPLSLNIFLNNFLQHHFFSFELCIRTRDCWPHDRAGWLVPRWLEDGGDFVFTGEREHIPLIPPLIQPSKHAGNQHLV
jgi:hypothetical protein